MISDLHRRLLSQEGEASRLADELIEYFSTLSDVPQSWYISSSSADEYAEPRLWRLRVLLNPEVPESVQPILEFREALTRPTRLRRQAELERMRQAEERAREAKESQVREDWFVQLTRNFLGVGDKELKTTAGEASIDQLKSWREMFVAQWFSRRGVPAPDAEQTRAIGAVHRHALVTARAGSGKTRTIVNRTLFLAEHCRVAPSELLLIAFNRKAAVEMSERLEKLGILCPHIMTFHALAYALVHPEQALVYDDEEVGNHSHTRVLQQVINDLLDRPDWRDRVRELMLDHFRADWESLIEKGLGGSMAEGLAFRRSLVAETLRGEYVKSRGEQLIANFLFEHDIAYLYERNHWWKGRIYRPDFTLEGRSIVIEYFGLTGDPSYDEQSEEKRRYWSKKNDWKFLEYSPEAERSTDQGGLVGQLKRDLKALGVPLRRLSDGELWERIRERILTRFASILRNFVGRCRKTGLSIEGLGHHLRRYSSSDDIERRFLGIATAVFDAYVERLRHQGQEDFDGLMERAVQLIESGTTAFDRKAGAGDLARIRFVMVDEFQDMSPLFVRMLEGIRRHNPTVQFFGVGDDWQAINAFAGSDLQFFEGFEARFKPARRLNISTNYRSARSVVELGNKIMAGRGEPAKPRQAAPHGRVIVADLSTLAPQAEEIGAWPGDQITPAVRRLLRASLCDGKTVALLARRDGLPYFVPLKTDGKKSVQGLEGMRRRWTEGLSKAETEAVALSTAHGFKGLEADVVVVLDAVDRSFPLVHPDWVFTRVFGDNIPKIIEDERRLFYVACTRAKETLFLLTEGHRESEFLTQIRTCCETLVWADYPAFVQNRGGWIIKVGSREGKGTSPTFERKDLLSANGFEFARGDWPHWWISLGASITQADVVHRILRAPWLPGPDGLEIHVCTSDGKMVEAFSVMGGVLQKAPATDGRGRPGESSWHSRGAGKPPPPSERDFDDFEIPY